MADIGQELLDVPFGKMIAQMGGAIAYAQTELDKGAIDSLAEMAKVNIDLPGKVGKNASLLSLGFSPTFYAFQETTLEVKLAITIRSHGEEDKTSKSGSGLWSTPVNAKYARSYQYAAEGASLLRTKLVAIPPPVAFQETIRQVIDQQEKEKAQQQASESPQSVVIQR